MRARNSSYVGVFERLNELISADSEAIAVDHAVDGRRCVDGLEEIGEGVCNCAGLCSHSLRKNNFCAIF